MICPKCAATTRPGTQDGTRFEHICMVHGPIGMPCDSPAGHAAMRIGARAAISTPKQAEAHTEPLVQTITLPYPPATNTLYATVNGRRVKSERAKDYTQLVIMLASEARLRMIEGPVCLSMKVYRPRKRGDLDGTIKCLQDSLSGICYLDDEAVCELHLWRYEDNASPRVEVTISSAA